MLSLPREGVGQLSNEEIPTYFTTSSSLLVLHGVDRADGEEFTAQLGPPSRRVLTDRQFAYAATIVSCVDLDEAIFVWMAGIVKWGPTGLVKHTTKFFVSDTRELGGEH
jgi:hypothetical protein